MDHSGLVSVIIPVYNVRPYLEEALDSVLGQTYEKLEILVIDDGSTDGSGEVCDLYAEKDGRIRVIHQENRGLSAARNAGLDRMAGEMVAFLDPDDAFLPSFIEEMVSAMARESVDVVICKFTRHATEGKLILSGNEKTYPSIARGWYDRTGALDALADGAINVGVWNKLYRRALWKDIRFVEGHVYEDVVATYKVFSLSNASFALNRPLNLQRIHPRSITMTYSETNLADLALSHAQQLAFVKENTPEVFTPRQLQQVHRKVLDMMLSSYARWPGSIGNVKVGFPVKLREKIIAEWKECDAQPLGYRARAAYAMLRYCPWLLRAIFPAYRAVRRGIWHLTGR